MIGTSPQGGREQCSSPRRPLNGTGFAPRDSQARGGHNRFLRKARPPRPSEPILIPKSYGSVLPAFRSGLSIDQRLFTLVPAADDGYELARVRRNLEFSRSRRPLMDAANCIFAKPKPVLPREDSKASVAYARQLFQSFIGRLLVVSRCHDGIRGPTVPSGQVLE